MMKSKKLILLTSPECQKNILQLIYN